MDLAALLTSHRLAVRDMSWSSNDDARRWAGDRADYYAERIVALQMKHADPRRSQNSGLGR
jgi:hypothetical protein